jgi:cytochrome P450
VILGILGLPNTDDAWLEELHATIHVAAELLSYTGTPPAETIERCTRAALHMQEMMRPYIVAKRDGTGEDFISRVWVEADELLGEGEWGDHDVIEIAALSFLAASETTVGTTASALYLLLKHPELQDELRADPALTPRFIEETMRLHSQISFRPRIAAQNLELGGVDVKRGEMVISLQEAASRDPAHYECPREIKLDRANPFDHFGFWRGPRQCPGRPLARLEMQTFVNVLLERVTDLRLDPDAEPPLYEGLLLRRWAPLNVLFTPAGG